MRPPLPGGPGQMPPQGTLGGAPMPLTPDQQQALIEEKVRVFGRRTHPSCGLCDLMLSLRSLCVRAGDIAWARSPVRGNGSPAHAHHQPTCGFRKRCCTRTIVCIFRRLSQGSFPLMCMLSARAVATHAGAQMAAAQRQALLREAQVRLRRGSQRGHAAGARSQDHQGACCAGCLLTRSKMHRICSWHFGDGNSLYQRRPAHVTSHHAWHTLARR